ncbi:MAG: flavin reductase family protein [Alphaproteobacteria bacterium]|nr:flavin reductase family protein [Alphaproteobacteria bacterium]
MKIAAADIGMDAAYKLLVGCIVPRPIAWVTTLSPEGTVNLAPFSAFTFVSSDPPMVAFSVGLREGQPKDTARNIDALPEFVVHIGAEDQIEVIHKSSAEYPQDVSETEALGLATVPSDLVKPPRLAAAPIAMECRLAHAIDFGREPSTLYVGEVVMFHARDGLVRDGKIDTAELKPAVRVASPNYARLGEIIRVKPMHRPSSEGQCKP